MLLEKKAWEELMDVWNADVNQITWYCNKSQLFGVCPLPAGTRCGQHCHSPIDCLKKILFSHGAFGGTRGRGLQSRISVWNRNQIWDLIIPISAHYLSFAEKLENAWEPFP